MDAIRLLRQDHREIDGLFKEFERTGEKAERQKKKLMKKIVEELSLHAEIEEQIFYPAVEQTTKDQQLVLKSMEEHDVVKKLLQELGKMEPSEERFQAKATVLFQTVRAHVREEESELFDKLKGAVAKPQLEELGTRIEEGKKAIRNPKDYLGLG